MRADLRRAARHRRPRRAAGCPRHRRRGRAGAFLAACGGDDDDDSRRRGRPRAAPAGCRAAGTAAGVTGTAAQLVQPLHVGRVRRPGRARRASATSTITIYNSNEEAIQKLVTRRRQRRLRHGRARPASYIPQLVGEDLLSRSTWRRITNFENLDPAYTNQAWDPGNKYSVCKDWGTTGWIYDKTVITSEITTWADFIDVAHERGQRQHLGARHAAQRAHWHLLLGQRHRLDDRGPSRARRLRGRSWSTSSPSTSRPSTRTPASTSRRATTRCRRSWNGDARQGLLSIEEAGGDPADYGLGQSAPRRPSCGWTTGAS